MIKTRLVIADPSLLDVRGHHFTLTQNISAGAIDLGLDVIWFAHQNFPTENHIENISINPVFSRTMYDQFKNPEQYGTADDRIRKFIHELRHGIAESGLNSNDHILFHTGFGDVFRAFLEYFRTLDWQKGPYIHICTPYDISTMPGKGVGSDIDIDEVFNAMRPLDGLDRKLFLWTETSELSATNTNLFGLNFRPLLLPPPRLSQTTEALQNAEILTVLYLGAAREEKGFLHLPKIAERLYETHGKSRKIKFIVQCTPQIVGYLPSIKKAIEQLSSYPSSYVQLITDVLSEEEYIAKLNQSDVVLLLYDRNNYACRGSGIAVEAISTNKCLLATANTFCANLITDNGGVALENMDDAANALGDIADSRDEYMANAERQGLKYRSQYNVKNYVYRILDVASSTSGLHFLPSTVIGHISPVLLGRNIH